MPPCPGINPDESLTPLSRLINDSIKSPSCPNIPIIIPMIMALVNDIKSRIKILAKIKTITENKNPKINPPSFYWD